MANETKEHNGVAWRPLRRKNFLQFCQESPTVRFCKNSVYWAWQSVIQSEERILDSPYSRLIFGPYFVGR